MYTVKESVYSYISDFPKTHKKKIYPMKIFKAYLLAKLIWLARFELGRELNLSPRYSVLLVTLLVWVPIVNHRKPMPCS